ncbi:hypothetical protein AVEN_101427-1 [Araneus ventricosus]|uniref:Uncharacterized protein n=1 Tax=Araneus ventricosus TaxID=182803 RepID=A0A4Y2CWJ1_ARAVE|nr:hypothetical protein AVEN_101427-1 [Araneus ventricosus]
MFQSSETHCLREGSKSQTYSHPVFSPKRGIAEFTNLDAGSKSRQKLCFLVTLTTGSQNAIRPFQSDFKLFRIPNIQSICANFHWLSTLTKSFPLPCSKDLGTEQR